MSDYYKPIILPEAQQDIRGIVLYIAQELFSPQAALDLQDMGDVFISRRTTHKALIPFFVFRYNIISFSGKTVNHFGPL